MACVNGEISFASHARGVLFLATNLQGPNKLSRDGSLSWQVQVRGHVTYNYSNTYLFARPSIGAAGRYLQADHSHRTRGGLRQIKHTGKIILIPKHLRHFGADRRVNEEVAPYVYGQHQSLFYRPRQALAWLDKVGQYKFVCGLLQFAALSFHVRPRMMSDKFRPTYGLRSFENPRI